MPAMQEFEKMFRGKASQVTQDEIDRAMDNAEKSTIVSLVVAPSEISRRAFCYKMLITADSYELVYFRKDRLTPKKGPGFLKSDLRRISKLLTPEFKANTLVKKGK